jgi:hypothetical protein
MKRLLITALVFAAILGTTSAQELTTGTLEGVVRDQDGLAVAGALISVLGPQGVKTTTADRQGRYVVRGLVPHGEYSVRAEAPGYAALIQSDVNISIDTRTQLYFTLDKGVTEEVTVISQAPIVDLKSTTTGASITVDDFAPYVALGRNLVSVMTVAPGVSDGGSIGEFNQSISGSSGLENAYFIDGVNVTDSGFGALGAYSPKYGSLGTGVTYEFLDEVQVKTGGLEAEYGQAGGGVVNTVVKSGTNGFNLDLSWYETPAGLEGTRSDRLDDPNFANTVESSRRDVALSLGGPFVRDRLFYFAAYNPVTTEQDFKLTSGNDLTPYFLEDTNGDNLICDGSGTCYDTNSGESGPAPGVADDPFFYEIGRSVNNGRVPDSVTRERHNDNYAAKLSWFATPNHKFELTAFGDPSKGEVGAQAPWTALRNLADPIRVPDPSTGASGLDYGGDKASFKYQGVWTSNFFTELLVAQSQNEFSEFGPGTESRWYWDTTTNATLGGVGYYENKVDETRQYSLKNTHVLGPVELRYGFQHDELKYRDPRNFSGPSYFAFLPVIDDVQVDSDGDGTADDVGLGFIAGCADGTAFSDPDCYQTVESSSGTYVNILGATERTYAPSAPFHPLGPVTRNEESSLFAQVSWDARPNLTFKLGLRYTQQKLEGAGEFTLPLGTTTISGESTGAFSTDYAARKYEFDPEFAPRLGLSWDVLNNGQHKLYANYGQYTQRVPSDLAVRQFSNEVSVIDEAFEDISLATPSANNFCWIDNDGDAVYDQQTPCHLVNVLGAEPGIILDGTQLDEGSEVNEALGFNSAFVSNATTRSPMTQEWLIGYAWEVNDFTGVELRYISRELGRVLEDVQFASNEQIFNQFFGGLLYPNYGGEVFPGHGVGSFGAYVLANVGGNVDSTMFPVPVRDYRSFEVVFNRRFKDGWMAYVNYRYATLEGNYEGSFRNDNYQPDPHITSLFDLPAASGMINPADDTTGYVESGTLRGQYLIGPLNTDRSHIVNGFVSKQFDFGLNVGLRATIRTGQPRFPLFAHPTYTNGGEIPGVNPLYWTLTGVDSTGDGSLDGFGLYFDTDATVPPQDQDYTGDGIVDTALFAALTPALYSYDAVKRDYFGRNPATMTWDLHLSYDFELRGGRSKLTLMADVFNIFNENGALTFDNWIEAQPGIPNPDYLKANRFHGPRRVRLGLKFSY